MHKVKPKMAIKLKGKVLGAAVLLAGLFYSPFLSDDQSAWAQEFRPTKEYQIKASLIFNFLQFVEWPPVKDGTSSTQNLRICLAGPDRFGVALTVLEREIISGKSIEVLRLATPQSDDLKRCHVLYITNNADNHVNELLSSINDMSILTIGESPEFLKQGGIINLVIKGDRILFEINRKSAFKARLNISSKLLRIAHQVIEG